MISFNLHHHQHQHLHQHQSHFRSFSTSSSPQTFLHGVWRIESREKWVNNGLRCSSDNAIIKPYSQVYTETLTSDPQQIKWHETMNIDHMQQQSHKITRSNAIMKLVNMIKSMLNSMGDGEITVSAYDTAWVALVKNIHGTGSPQFPSSLEWIVKNQLEDGSWGFSELFLAHDRLINTLACVIALKSWNLSPERCEKGMKFIRENMCKLEHDRAEHMLIGFEVAFPSLIELARNINLEILDDSSFLQDIYAKRNLKLKRIPKDMMHSVPTTLLHSLEGMLGLDWEKLLKLQCLDGSFLFSPSSTAFALMQTKDENCLKYLNKVVKRFNGGVPNVYPVDLFEHIWVVDRLDRLGISRYFQSEINQCLDYVYRYYSEDGICWARNSKVHDIDDTAMAFRLLRLHGYDISHNVFHHFEKGGEFFCFAGQSNQALTGIYNLYRASQLSFPDERILDEAKTFAYKFLREKQASNQLLLDKWIIIKDLPGEVGYALDVPWYASLPRIETRLYIEQYGGEDDVWIGKTLYRMPYVNNNTYLELAKLDYNNCQALHQSEWIGILKWYAENNLKDLGVKMRKLLESYFLAMSNIYEPKRAIERLAWAKTTVVMEVVSTYMRKSSIEKRRAFIHAFNSGTNIAYYDDKSLSNKSPTEEAHQQKLMDALVTTLNHLSLDAKVVHGKDICTCLNKLWETWMMIQMNEEDNGGGAELIVRTIAMFRSSNNNCSVLEGELSHRDFDRLATLTNRIYQQLGRIRNNKDCEKGWCNGKSNSTITLNVESQMKELLQYVLCSTDGLDREIKHAFLTIAKSSFYAAYCNPSTIRLHIAKRIAEMAFQWDHKKRDPKKARRETKMSGIVEFGIMRYGHPLLHGLKERLRELEFDIK